MGWVLGWAISEAWFAPLARAAFPDAQHVFVVPTPTALAQLEAAGPFDWIVGYSLGSLLLLTEVARAERLGRVALLAPIFAFPREKNSGGRVALAQIRQLARWLRRDPTAALVDFYQRAGLDGLEVGRVIPNAPNSGDGEAPERRVKDNPPYHQTIEELSWGLERLEQDAAGPALPAGWRAWCGANDPLLDATRLRELAPVMVIVPGGGHHPAALLRAFGEAVA